EEERDSAWSDFLSEADSLPDVKIEPTPAARKSLSDRLAYLTLEGYLPLGALAAVLLSLASGHSSATVWLAGLACTPILVLIFQPLARTRYGLRLPGLWILWPLSLVAASLVSGAARSLEHRLTAGQMHPEFVALALQRGLESLLTPASLGIAFLALVLLSLILRWVHERFPWIQIRPRQSFAARTTPILALILTLCCLGWLFLSTRINADSQDWVQRTQESALRRAYSSLPQETDDRYWRDLKDVLDKNLEDNRTHTVTGDYYWTPDNVRAATKGLPIPPLESHSPASLSELEAARNYLSWMGDMNRPSGRLQPMLESLLLAQSTRPTRDSGDWMWLHSELSKEIGKVKDKTQLLETLEKLRNLRKNLGSPETGLQERALHTLITDPGQLSKATEIGWRSVDNLVRPDKFSKGWAYTANPAPQPLRALNYEFEHSPTKFVSLFQRRRLLKRWVEIQPEFERLSWEAKMKRLKVERDSLPLEGTVEDAFWKSLLEWETAPQEIEILQQAELMVLLKLSALERGQFPDKLDTLAGQVDFPEKLSKFEWDPKAGKLRIGDNETGVSLP
ncbi:MAG: hypothetical protein KC800_15210, partial [Candidatus Eremiobacteraeota bacterium]|nr:hypothetical protein [Candidatus Eremiobacteraeota bacterium]